MKPRRAVKPAGRAEKVRSHLLVQVNTRAPQELLARSEGHDTTVLQLAGVPLAELGGFTERVWSRVTVALPGWPHLRLFALPARLLGQTSDLLIRMTRDPASS